MNNRFPLSPRVPELQGHPAEAGATAAPEAAGRAQRGAGEEAEAVESAAMAFIEAVSKIGYLARPDQGLSALLGGAGRSVERFPAVVVLHGCSGISSHSVGIADRLGSEGYVALAVDSLGPRGVASRCGSNGYPEQAFDAYSARRYLAQLPPIDWPRTAIRAASTL